MKEFIIDACKWYVDDEMDDTTKLDTIGKFISRYEPLLGFLLERQLYKQNLPKALEDWQSLEIKYSDFTEEGLELVMYCHDRWLDRVEKGISPKNINLWIRELSKLRQDPNETMH